jgi:AcrR family transcriptional regulator
VKPKFLETPKEAASVGQESRTGEETRGGASVSPGILTPSVPQDIGVQTQRHRILEAMAKSCAEKTFSATTIADIVSHASISRGTFYKHFTNKQDCFYAAADTFLLELQSAAAIAYARSADLPTEMVCGVISAVLETLAAKPEQARLLLVEAPLVDPEIVRRYRNFVMGALEKQLRAGGMIGHGKADPEIAFGRAKVLIADYVAAGQVEQLPELLPELVYIALLPYAGQETALEQAEASR